MSDKSDKSSIPQNIVMVVTLYDQLYSNCGSCLFSRVWKDHFAFWSQIKALIHASLGSMENHSSKTGTHASEDKNLLINLSDSYMLLHDFLLSVIQREVLSESAEFIQGSVFGDYGLDSVAQNAGFSSACAAFIDIAKKGVPSELLSSFLSHVANWMKVFSTNNRIQYERTVKSTDESNSLDDRNVKQQCATIAERAFELIRFAKMSCRIASNTSEYVSNESIHSVSHKRRHSVISNNSTLSDEEIPELNNLLIFFLRQLQDNRELANAFAEHVLNMRAAYPVKGKKMVSAPLSWLKISNLYLESKPSRVSVSDIFLHTHMLFHCLKAIAMDANQKKICRNAIEALINELEVDLIKSKKNSNGSHVVTGVTAAITDAQKSGISWQEDLLLRSRFL